MKKIIMLVLIALMATGLFSQFKFINEQHAQKAKNFFTVVQEEELGISFLTFLNGVTFEFAFTLNRELNEDYDYSYLAVKVKTPQEKWTLEEEFNQCQQVFDKVLTRIGLNQLTKQVEKNFTEVFNTQTQGHPNFDIDFTVDGTVLRTRIMQSDDGLVLGLFEFQRK